MFFIFFRLVATERGLNVIDSLLPTIINILQEFYGKSSQNEPSDKMDLQETIDTG
jgi:hypothetical protein